MYLEEWDEHTGISWCNESRKKINKIIRKFNQWQINGMKEKKSKETIIKNRKR